MFVRHIFICLFFAKKAAMLPVFQPTSPPYWHVLGFQDGTKTILNVGNVDYQSIDEAALEDALSELATCTDDTTHLKLSIHKLYGIENTLSHLQHFIPFIQSHSTLQITSSSFRSNAIRKYIKKNFDLGWPTLTHLILEIDTTSFEHCVHPLRMFSDAHLEKCTIQVDSYKLFSVAAYQETSFLQLLINSPMIQYAHIEHLELLVIVIDIESIDEKKDQKVLSFQNLRWLQVLLDKTRSVQLTFQFEDADRNQIPTMREALCSQLQSVWKVQETNNQNSDCITFKRETCGYVCSREHIWFPATPFWQHHYQSSLL